MLHFRFCVPTQSRALPLLIGNGSGQPGLEVGDPAHSRGLKLDDHCGPLQPRPFCGSTAQQMHTPKVRGSDLSGPLLHSSLVKKQSNFVSSLVNCFGNSEGSTNIAPSCSSFNAPLYAKLLLKQCELMNYVLWVERDILVFVLLLFNTDKLQTPNVQTSVAVFTYKEHI